jgi:hypothetical protein
MATYWPLPVYFGYQFAVLTFRAGGLLASTTACLRCERSLLGRNRNDRDKACWTLQQSSRSRECRIPHKLARRHSANSTIAGATVFPLTRKSVIEGIDFRMSPHDMCAVGLERSRPAFPRHFAQVLHLAR